MSITFQENIFFPKNFSVGQFKVDETVYHYKVSSDIQQQRWFVAITKELDGQITHQMQWSKGLSTYAKVLEYIQELPSLINGINNLPSQTDKMTDELDRLIARYEIELENLIQFRKRYCGERKI